MSEIFGVIVGGIFVIGAILAWRLSSAPIEGNFIRPYIEQEINSAGLGFQVSIDDAKLGWHRLRPSLDLNLHGVKIYGPDKTPIGSLDEGSLEISLRAMLFGRFQATELDLVRPEILVVRGSDDTLSLHLGGGDTAAGATANAGNSPSFLSSMLAPPGDHGALGSLRRLKLVDGKVRVDDRKTAIAWSAPDVDIDVSRGNAGLDAKINVALALPQGTGHFTGNAKYTRADGLTRISLDVDNFDASMIAPLWAPLAPAAALSMSTAGQVHAVIARTGDMVSGDVTLRGTDGHLVLPAYYADPVNLHSAELTAKLAAAPRRLTLEKLALDFGDATIGLAGTADFEGPKVSIDARADYANLLLARFNALWPQGVGAGARDWVTTHIPAGVIKSGTMHVAANGQTSDLSTIQVSALDGTFDYTGLEVHYFPPLLPVKDIAGRAKFDATRMDLAIDKGALGNIAVTQGSVGIAGLDKSDPAADVALTIDGPLSTALTILDTKPLGYIHRLGFDPGGVGGHLNARATFSLPLIKDLSFAQIALGTKGKLDQVAIAGAVAHRDVTEGNLDIALDKKGMRLSGDARLSGVPMTVDWRESFVDADKIRSQIAVRGTLDDAGRKTLGLEIPGFVALKGKVGLSGDIAIDRKQGMTIAASTDLQPADLTLGPLGLHKPAGEAGTASASLDFVDGTLRSASRLTLESNSAKLDGSASFNDDGALKRAYLAHVSGGLNDYVLAAESKTGDLGAFAITVNGTSFDAGPFLNDQGEPGTPPVRTPRLDLTVGVDQVYSAPGRKLDAVKGTANLTGSRLDRANIQASAGNKPLTLVYEPSGNVIALHVTSDDAGAVLNGLGITGGVRGGLLRIEGKTTGGDGPRLTTGTLDMNGYRLINAPIIARLVNAMSLTGFVDLLSGQGLEFDKMTSEIDYTNEKLTFRRGRATGALGISFEGDIDLDRNLIDLKGTVVPIATLNSMIAAIPLIGGLVSGGERGGFLGTTYTVKGTTDDPRVSVNPLSMFAPGFLRNLFFLGPSEPAPKATENPQTSPAPVPPIVAPPPAESGASR